MQKVKLRDAIDGAYSVEEMKLLCRNLGVNWEDINTTIITRKMFAQEIVDYFDRHGHLYNLLEQVRIDRPHLFYSLDNQEYATSEDFDESQYVQADNRNTILWIILIAIIVTGAYFFFSWNDKQKEKDPNVFITNYFSSLDNLYFSSAWEKLSGDYRIKKHPTGYTPYAEYYRSFKKIEILKAEVLEETDTTATVRVFLALTKLDGGVVNQDIIFKLSRPTKDDLWLITDSSP
ncbi:MAG TPA: hypothetical protein EYP90_06480 [Chromatiaceae bacterium]|nr:hypothetical protein [Chromatiaceae bacterium]